MVQLCSAYTPLHTAAMAGQLAAAQWLVAVGADVSAVDTAGATPLHRASGRRGNTAVVSFLLEVRLVGLTAYRHPPLFAPHFLLPSCSLSEREGCSFPPPLIRSCD
jgi:ankyrin repeat protein